MGVSMPEETELFEEGKVSLKKALIFLSPYRMNHH